MSDDSGENEPSGSDDAFLRAIAAAPEQAPPSGARLDPARISHFRVLGRLGKGGMGIVYKAEDESLGRVVALKVLPPGVEDDAERRKRLLREARVAAIVTHPNIATVYEVGEADGRIFVAMEHVEGETLRTRIARGDLPTALAMDIAAQIARGLAKAHAANIVHRDLKPENIILTTDGRVKILDFGLAKHVAPEAPTPSAFGELETATLDGHILGTPAYMSPEQASSGSIDARSDLFALGVMLYEMTTGARPFVGETAASTLAAVLRDAPKPPSARSAKVSAALERVILRCLEKKPADRFASADELLAALEILESRASKHVPRRGTGALVLVLALVGGVAVLAVGLRGRNRAATVAPISVASANAPAPAAASVVKTMLVDRPPPRSSNPEALAAYAAALQELHDTSLGPAVDDFERAAELDPTFAAAHLRSAFWGTGNYEGPFDVLPTETRRAHEMRAAQYRSSLSDGDQGLLDCLELPDSKARDACDLALARHYPGDVELAYIAALSDRSDEALLARVAALDPKLALVPYFRERLAYQTGRPVEEVLRFANECLSLAPRSANCLAERIRNESAAGHCETAEVDARRLVALVPAYSAAHGWLADALIGRGADPESVAAVQAKARSLLPGAQRARAAIFDAFVMAMLRADFGAADREAEASERLLQDSTSEGAHLRNAILPRIMNYLEMGESESALGVAASFERRRAALIADAPEGRTAILAYLVRANRAAASQLEAARAVAIAAPLAGRAPEALTHLRRAARACADSNYDEYVRGKALFGEALEATGDRDGACEAYADVIARWGRAKPRSVTADKARARAAALGCKK